MCFFVARLSKQREHIALIALHSGLVKRIHAQYIAADAAGKLEEIK